MTPARPRIGRTPPVSLKFASAAAALLVGVAAGQPPATRPADDALALSVQRALANDPVLGTHKLGLLVNVMDGVAVIGGPVPNQALAPRVEAVAAAVSGIVRAKVSVWVIAPARGDPLLDRLEEKLADRPQASPQPRPVTLGVPADPADPRPTASVTGRSAPAPVLEPPVMSVARAAPHPRPPGAEPPEYTPIPATNLPTEPVPEPLPASRATAPESPAGRWKQDPRFARLTVEVRNGTAVIGGRARSHAAAWELAEEVRGWPTVERVVVGRVEVPK